MEELEFGTILFGPWAQTLSILATKWIFLLYGSELLISLLKSLYKHLF